MALAIHTQPPTIKIARKGTLLNLPSSPANSIVSPPLPISPAAAKFDAKIIVGEMITISCSFVIITDNTMLHN